MVYCTVSVEESGERVEVWLKEPEGRSWEYKTTDAVFVDASDEVATCNGALGAFMMDGEEAKKVLCLIDDDKRKGCVQTLLTDLLRE